MDAHWAWIDEFDGFVRASLLNQAFAAGVQRSDLDGVLLEVKQRVDALDLFVRGSEQYLASAETLVLDLIGERHRGHAGTSGTLSFPPASKIESLSSCLLWVQWVDEREQGTQLVLLRSGYAELAKVVANYAMRYNVVVNIREIRGSGDEDMANEWARPIICNAFDVKPEIGADDPEGRRFVTGALVGRVANEICAKAELTVALHELLRKYVPSYLEGVADHVLATLHELLRTKLFVDVPACLRRPTSTPEPTAAAADSSSASLWRPAAVAGVLVPAERRALDGSPAVDQGKRGVDDEGPGGTSHVHNKMCLWSTWESVAFLDEVIREYAAWRRPRG